MEESFQFLSYGKGKQNPFKINPLSIHPDKKEYAPGDTARLLVTSDYPDARVWTFLRNSWKNESRRLVSLDRQTALVECRLTREDMPNMGVNAFTVRNGELHEASAELLIPPAGQLLAPSIVPGKSQYRPGEQGNVTIQVKGPDGKPVSADITRTYPVNGTYTERQRQVYDIVLAANREVAKTAKPGMTLKELNEIAKKVLAAGCMKLGLIEKEDEIDTYYMHGVSHHLGIDVHDVTAACNETLQPGAIITDEPGLYIDEWEIGIRIEDDLLITENGCECLSEAIIRDPDEIEAFMKDR